MMGKRFTKTFSKTFSVILSLSMLFQNSMLVFAETETETEEAIETQQEEIQDIETTDDPSEEEVHNEEDNLEKNQNALSEESASDVFMEDIAAENSEIVKYETDGTEYQLNGYTYEELNGSYAKITGYTGSAANLKIPETLGEYTVQVIGSSAFKGNTTLVSVEIPASVETIESEAFRNCTGLKTVGVLGAKKIGMNAFNGCTSLENVNLADTVTVITTYAFYGCTSLKEMNLPNSVTNLGYRLFGNCTALERVNYPISLSDVSTEGVNSWDRGQIYYNCPKMTELVIPSGVTRVVNDVYSGCTSLQRVEFPESVTEIGQRAFQGCTGLSEIDIPAKTEKIGLAAFSGCTGLRSVNLPEGLKIISTNAFSSDTGLTEVHIPDSVETLGYRVFENCTGLTETNYPLSLKNLTTEGVNSWDRGQVYYGCTGLSEMTIPTGITSIVEYIYANHTSLKKINIPETVTDIQGHVFEGCTGLREVKLPSELSRIGISAFSGCTGLTGIELPGKLTTISTYGFSGCTGLKKIEMPDSLTTVGYRVFGNCTGLQEVTFSKNLTQIITEGVNSWDRGQIFYNCEKLRTLSLPEGLTVIPANLFENCVYLRHVLLPSTLTSIGAGAFNGCIGLPYINLNEGLTSIGENAFNNCDGLINLVIPSTVASIGNNAFANNQNLKKALFKNSISSMGKAVFSGAHEDFTIYCSKYSSLVEYALVNKHNFIPVDSDDSAVIDRSKSWFSTNQYDVTVSGCINLLLNYRIKDDVFDSVTDTSASIVLNDNLNILDDSITVNGVQTAAQSIKDNTITIPVTDQEGLIRVTVRPTSARNLFAVAKLNYTIDETKTTEVIDYIYTEIPTVTIIAPQMTGSVSFNVSGVAPAQSAVNIYLDGKLNTTVNASKGGNYQAEVRIDQPVSGHVYTVKASVTGNGYVSEQTTKVRYMEGQPELMNLKMYYWLHDSSMNYYEQSVDLTNGASSLPAITFNPRYDYRFTVELTHPENVNSVYVTSRRNNDIKFLEAKWDSEAQQFVTSGKFDPSNSSYVPGLISVEYMMGEGTADLSGNIDTDDERYFSDIPSNVQNAVVSEPDVSVENGVKTTTVNVTLDNQEKSVLTVTTKEQAAVRSVSALLSQGYIEVTGNDGTYGYVKVEIDKYTITETMYDQARNKLIETCIKNNGGGELLDIWGFAQDGMVGEMNVALTYFEIQASNMSPAQKEAAMKQLYMMRDYYCASLVMDYMFFCAALICPELAIPLAFLHAAADKTLRGYYDDQINGGGMSFNGVMNLFFDSMFEVFKDKLKWIIDPSGTIYEGVTTNTLDGVKTTVYYKDPETGEVSEWNAEEYDQINPIVTNADGTFSWDVPEGLWQVKAEKEGYETYYTEWLEVPPPQTGLLIRMIPTAAPEIVSINSYKDGMEIIFSQYMDPETVKNIGLTDVSGNAIPYELVYDSLETDENRNVYAKIFRLKYTEEQTEGTEVNLSADNGILVTADGKAMSAVNESLNTKEKENIVTDDEIITVAGQSANISFEIENYSEGQQLEAVSSDPVLLEIRDINISEDGKGTVTVKAVAVGTAAVMLNIKDTFVFRTVSVTIDENHANAIIAGSITLDMSELKLGKGMSRTLTAYVMPNNTTDKSIIWSSDNKTVAAVDSAGKVTAVSSGTANITAETVNGLQAVSRITVVDDYIEIYGSSLALEGKIGINFYLDIPEDKLNDLAVVMNSAGEDIRVAANKGTAKTVSGRKLRMFVYPVAAKEMRDTVKITVEDKDGSKIMLVRDEIDYTDGYIYSAGDYFRRAEEAGQEKTKKLARVLNNYGKYAQIYFNYNVTNEVKNTIDVSSVTLETLEPYQMMMDSTELSGLTYVGGSAMLDDAIGYRLYFNLETGHEISEYTFTIDGNKVTPVLRTGTQYYIEKANIAAKDLGVMNEIKVTDGTRTKTIRYSALSYAYTALGLTEEKRIPLQNMCRAMYLYNQQAIEYFNTK